MVKLNLEIPEGWLEPEEKWGFQVTRQRKEIWAVELDLLHELDRVCKKHGLTFFADSGTMLGAIRHKGFIPWDDDIDVAMMRDEYEQLCKIAGEEFSYPYFFQTEYTDHGTLRGHAQLRNSMTTAVLKDENHTQYPFNQGIFIDIFPLDAAAPNEKLLKKQKKRLDLLMTQAWDSYFSGPGYHEDTAWKKNRLLHPIMPVLGKVWDYKKIMRSYFREAQRFNSLNTKYVAKVAYACGDRRMYDLREGFETYTMAPFEMLEVPLYGDYVHHLKRQYGDYMKFVIGTADHGGLIFDPDMPADEWLRTHQDEVKKAVDQLHGRAEK